ncbi:unnamed protein product [Mycena citricolor]|uniref:Uncharacterized protein n=1 Tax=Mycena citricolor TaxID=2018698 RepID=A0AAD2JZU4_9AGAR|nr:unnamed protein product [Mycena citricolor]
MNIQSGRSAECAKYSPDRLIVEWISYLLIHRIQGQTPAPAVSGLLTTGKRNFGPEDTCIGHGVYRSSD